MSVIRFVGRALNAVLCVLLGLLLVANLYTIAVRNIKGTPQPAVLGWSWAVVISGSMEPEIGVHDLVVVHRQPEYSNGDIITYESGDSVVTHRITGKTAEGFITRGDANNAYDLYPVAEDAVVGKVVYVIPRVGLFIEYLRTPLGMCCMVFIGLLLIEIPWLLQKGSKSKGGRH